MTKHEVTTLNEILRLGGKVKLTMGKTVPGTVRVSTLHRLADRGFVREWSTGRKDFRGCSREHAFDLEVTAAGCKALALQLRPSTTRLDPPIACMCGAIDPPRPPGEDGLERCIYCGCH